MPAPTAEKYSNPNTSGSSEITNAAPEIIAVGFSSLALFLRAHTNANTVSITVSSAVISGAKFAYPKGVKLKYE